MSNKSHFVILYIISALLATCLSYAFVFKLQFDSNSSAGVIVATLCGIIALLIGFQIYNAIDIKQDLKRNAIIIRRFENRFRRDLALLNESVKENRFLSDALIINRRLDDCKRWNDIPLIYIETAQLMIFLIRSNVNKYNITEEGDLLFDSFRTLDDCLNELNNKKEIVKIQMFNSYYSIFDKFNHELMLLLLDSHYNQDNNYLEWLSSLKNRRAKILADYGIFDKSKTDQERRTESVNKHLHEARNSARGTTEETIQD